jgi:hypothetical protein
MDITDAKAPASPYKRALWFVAIWAASVAALAACAAVIRFWIA